MHKKNQIEWPKKKERKLLRLRDKSKKQKKELKKNQDLKPKQNKNEI